MTSKTATHDTAEDQDGYYELERLIAERVAALTGPLFTTDAVGLWQAYLENLPAERWRHYNCHACRRFIERYGGLASISDGGSSVSALWNEEVVPDFFLNSTMQMRIAVETARVNGVFLNGDKTWGTPATTEAHGGQFRVVWTHLSGTPALPMIWKDNLKTAGQAMAEKAQEYAMLRRGLAEFSGEVIQQAVRVLNADALYRSEKAQAVAQWLLDLKRRVEGLNHSRQKDNLCWLAVAKAPPGFCHVRSTIIGTLLEDIVAGLEFEEIKRRWASKLHPLQYQRPTTIKDGAVEQAEKVVAQLGAQGSLARRFARLEDVTALWMPAPEQPVEAADPGGVFAHLKAGKQKVRPLELPAQSISWEHFHADVLPQALGMTCLVPAAPAPFVALVTAVNPEAPPILQWDGLVDLPRNPVSLYLYQRGSLAQHWNLPAGIWVPVTAVCANPAHWQRPDLFKHQVDCALFLLGGCRDSYEAGKSGGFFPECLKAEYHGIRQVMEAYAMQATVEGKEQASACGLMLVPVSQGFHITVKVASKDDERKYLIDRWQ